MTTAASSRPRPLLQWTFHRRGRFVTCQLNGGRRGRPFTLSVIPHFDGATEQTETFGSGIEALHRHAVIAQSLRASGWLMASYGNPGVDTAQAA